MLIFCVYALVARGIICWPYKTGSWEDRFAALKFQALDPALQDMIYCLFGQGIGPYFYNYDSKEAPLLRSSWLE